MIRVAERDEFLAILVDRKEGNIPAIGVGRILNLAGSLMWNDLEAGLQALRRARGQNCDGYPSIAVPIA